MTERYLKIVSCKDCPDYGHAGTSKVGLTTFMCANLENREIEQIPAEKISDKYYPITHIGKLSEDVPIPFWCKLPLKVN